MYTNKKWKYTNKFIDKLFRFCNPKTNDKFLKLYMNRTKQLDLSFQKCNIIAQ